MDIYKITNKKNGKVYIGQTIRPVEQRFKRHITDALHWKLDTYFARAVRKYGEGNFELEVIDHADTREELTKKEKYWIDWYDSCNDRNGYNSSHGGFVCGGNTYANLNNLDEVKRKLSASKQGGKNPNSRKVLIKNIEDGGVSVFDSMQEAADHLGLCSHMPISRRARKVVMSPLFGKYAVEYCNEESVTTIESA